VAKPTGFLEYPRRDVAHRTVEQRVKDYFEIDLPHPPEVLTEQAARCMDCGIAFCHGVGCPLANRIPEYNDLVYRNRWEQACRNLHSTNNFPEITGRICPAPCEAACTLNIDDQPVLIRHIELQIVERGWQEGWIQPLPAPTKTDKRVAVIGSGPAGLAAAQQLTRAGHDVTVFEKDDRIGGLLRYGIPDFKLQKKILDRRLDQLVAEGVTFQTDVFVGQDVSVKYLRQQFDVILLCMGAGQPRDLPVAGRDLQNVHFAMEYLTQQNRINADESIPAEQRISAADKIVVVLGGGDTGSDCVGTAVRQGARQVHQWEILPQPPETPSPRTPWPLWPDVLRTSSSQEEGCQRRWSVMTTQLTGSRGSVSALHGVEVDWTQQDGAWKMTERPGTEFAAEADLVLLAMGFVHAVHDGLINSLGLQLDERGNIAVDANYETSQAGIFAAGDTHRGASLVVHAIAAGRHAAEAIDRRLNRGNS